MSDSLIDLLICLFREILEALKTLMDFPLVTAADLGPTAGSVAFLLLIVCVRGSSVCALQADPSHVLLAIDMA